MSIAQGIDKFLSIKKQTGLGVPATGSGGQLLRRKTATFNLAKDVYTSDEIASHQQSTGNTHGLRKVDGKIDGLLSPLTYSTLLGSLLRKDFVATAPIASVDVVISGTAPSYQISRATGSWLTGGIKIGDVIRLSVGALDVANINKNLLVTNVTALDLDVRSVNATTLTAETVTGVTVTVVGKKTMAPLTGHTRDYWTVEEWFSDLGESRLYTDCGVSSCDIALPSTGNATVAFSFAGLNRTVGQAQVLTTPAAETTTPILAAVNGLCLVDGQSVGYVTGATMKIDGSVASIGAVIGSNVAPDLQRGRIKVSGQITAFFQDGALSALFDNATNSSIVLVVADGSANNAEFVAFNISQLKFDGDALSDGETALVITIPFTGAMNVLGGPTAENDKTIIGIQDSAA